MYNFRILPFFFAPGGTGGGGDPHAWPRPPANPGHPRVHRARRGYPSSEKVPTESLRGRPYPPCVCKFDLIKGRSVSSPRRDLDSASPPRLGRGARSVAVGLGRAHTSRFAEHGPVRPS
ncbi:hypothetical protein NL676_002262 [Syzygium grande]|nr:hypothetical protein NL676_002262 [Syzygium grande]